jgi:hypothetical protein
MEKPPSEVRQEILSLHWKTSLLFQRRGWDAKSADAAGSRKLIEFTLTDGAISLYRQLISKNFLLGLEE